MQEVDDSPALDLLFGSLSDSTRRNILELLVDRDMTVKEISDALGRSIALTSKHVAVLVKSGLVSRRPDGRSRLCRLEPDAIRRAVIWLEGFGLVDLESLEGLEWLLEDEQENGDGQ